MRCSLFINALWVLLLINSSCKKKSSTTDTDCFSGAATVRTITNGEAAVALSGGIFFIIEKNTIDTKLLPCNLPDEFKTDKLNVKITGEVKITFSSGVGPCCTENFVIQKISK